ncbi:Retrovirus-related Pol polyprotein from transposon [Dictyocoela muelleri]|nr:Retrovirus-related Pol polyprotein from transposon [Dictyocoela muelleri]
MLDNSVNIDYSSYSVTIEGRTIDLLTNSSDSKSNKKLLMSKEQIKLNCLINKYNPKDQIGKYTGFKHKIILKSEPKIKIKHYPTPFNLREKAKEMFHSLLKRNIIRKSNSLYCSPAFLIPKKSGNLRLVVDYSEINNSTIKEVYPCRNIEECLIDLHGSEIFTTLDLNLGYHQIEMNENSIKYTSFSLLNDPYEFLRMPFTLTNAPRSFQRAMNNILGHLDYVKLYLDDILIFSNNMDLHMIHLETTFQLLHEAGLTLNIGKCKFIKKEVEYLGHIINKHGGSPNLTKIESHSKLEFSKK